jgi:uncharacterized protein
MSEISNSPPVLSPCVGGCYLDARRLCRGCHRHIDEIAEWSRASSARRMQIRRAAALRALADAYDIKSDPRRPGQHDER